MPFAAAASFARQTGDLRSLSRVDLRVIALTYMLERQETGASHLRTAPVRAVRPARCLDALKRKKELTYPVKNTTKQQCLDFFFDAARCATIRVQALLFRNTRWRRPPSR